MNYGFPESTKVEPADIAVTKWVLFILVAYVSAEGSYLH